MMIFNMTKYEEICNIKDQVIYFILYVKNALLVQYIFLNKI